MEFSTLNLKIFHDHLIQNIRRFGQESREARQVYRRLHQLLPDRIYLIAKSKGGSYPSGAKNMRLALASEEIHQLINEIVEVGANSLEARIQFETHMMLIDARRTLRRMRRN